MVVLRYPSHPTSPHQQPVPLRKVSRYVVNYFISSNPLLSPVKQPNLLKTSSRTENRCDSTLHVEEGEGKTTDQGQRASSNVASTSGGDGGGSRGSGACARGRSHSGVAGAGDDGCGNMSGGGQVAGGNHSRVGRDLGADNAGGVANDGAAAAAARDGSSRVRGRSRAASRAAGRADDGATGRATGRADDGAAGQGRVTLSRVALGGVATSRAARGDRGDRGAAALRGLSSTIAARGASDGEREAVLESRRVGDGGDLDTVGLIGAERAVNSPREGTLRNVNS